ncbi:MAG: cbb3-type cytochrome c oxidase subunit I [Crocinitomicaceae bacterium]|nr:cbb3-type cytochrome c oxidase subunit I [Crocinitomicaceae bacterium]
MERNKTIVGRKFLSLALVSLFVGLIGGVLASITYIKPDFLHDFQGLSKLRPIHVSFVMFWIIIAANGGVYIGMSLLSKNKPLKLISNLQIILWIIALLGIGYSYLIGDFGGREYWEFNPIWALPILIALVLQLVNFIHLAKSLEKWPVYVWMWMSGTVFFLLIFIENYLWLFPYFRAHFITDMTIQWKVNGSLVGSFNQLVYATAFFMMDRINGTKEFKIGSSKLAFSMWLLGLGNMMFNWSHHIYTLPTESYIRYIGYIVSMTEWIIFLRIVYLWKNSLNDFKKNYHYFPYRFIMASDIWVFINVGFACLMSIPALNIFTHGTHFTVAHSMGTTIGINTMILLACVFMFFTPKKIQDAKPSKSLSIVFWVIQLSLLSLFLSLKISGVIKGFWQLDANQSTFYEMMQGLRPFFIVFVISGTVLMLGFFYLIGTIYRYSRINKNQPYESEN